MSEEFRKNNIAQSVFEKNNEQIREINKRNFESKV